MIDTCVCCGKPIPEGRQICPDCDDTRSLIERLKERIAYLEGSLDDKCDICVRRERTKTIQEFECRMALHFGTYTDKDTITVHELFKLIGKISEKILEEQK